MKAACRGSLLILMVSLSDHRAVHATDPPAPKIVFENVATRAGVDFRFHTGSRNRHDLPEIMGGGVALIDADSDGWLDIYFCNGGPIGPAAPDASDPPCRLFHNNHDGTF